MPNHRSQRLSLCNPVELQQFEAVQLFLDRTSNRLPGFFVDDASAQAMATFCRDLDGLPLAIELAAARVPMPGTAELSERLDDCFRVLIAGSRTGLPRQHTLRSTLDWSCGLLTDPERRAFACVSVVAGGLQLWAAERVLGGEAIKASDDVDLTAQSVDRRWYCRRSHTDLSATGCSSRFSSMRVSCSSRAEKKKPSVGSTRSTSRI